MNEPEIQAAPASEAADLKQECAELRKRANFMLFALVVLSFTLTGVLLLQFWRTSRELEAVRPQATQIMELNRKQAPVIEKFMTQLVDYARTHPDLATNLARRGIKLDTAKPGSTVAPPGLSTPPIDTPTR